MINCTAEQPCVCGIVSIDGPSGAGKSSLAGALREEFDLPVLEIGPLFRYVAWLSRVGEAPSMRAAAATLIARLQSESLYCDLHRAGPFSATGLLHRGRPLDDELWDRGLGSDVVSASADSVVAAYVMLTARSLLRELPRAVVVGRTSRAFGFDRGSVALRLDADPEVRNDRKEEQLRIRDARAASIWEAVSNVKLPVTGYRIDTSNSSALAVALRGRQILVESTQAHSAWPLREAQAS
jgi:cytidylate kinase